MESISTGQPDVDLPAMIGRGRRLRLLMSLDAVGGVWRYAMELAEALIANEVDVVFFGCGPRPSPEQKLEAEDLGELVWSDLPLDWTAKDESQVAGVGEKIAQAAALHSVDLIQLNLPSQAAFLDVDMPVVVVSHSCVATWFARMGAGPLPPDLEWQKRHARAGFDRAAAVITPSESHAKDLAACYGPIDNLHVVHNAVSRLYRPGVRKDVVFAAARWWDKAKNGAMLDEAAALCQWPVLMAGSVSGPNHQHLDIHNACHIGQLPAAEVADYMSQAAIFASPSIYEPFGLAALEAARAGAALVLADMPTYRELWEDAALFADPHDARQFAEQINRLARDKVLRLTYADNARERGRRFRPAKQAAAMLSIFEDVLARHHNPESVN